MIGRGARFLHGASLFATAACGLIVEIVAGRLLAPYVGMSLYTWTAIIAVVLAGFSIGNWIGGLLSGPDLSPARGARRVSVALVLAAATTLMAQILLRRYAAPVLEADLGTIPAIVLLTTLAFLAPSLFVGIVSPILTKLAVDSAPDALTGRIIGRMFALGALGSIAGTLLAGYVFISWIGSAGTLFAVAGTYALLALVFVAADRRRGLVLLAVVGAGGSLWWWGEASGAFRSPCTLESDYFCIRTEDFASQTGRESRLMVLDHLAHSMSDRADPTLLYSPYLHFVDELTRARLGPERAPSAFFIGGGGYSLPRAWAYEHRDRAAPDSLVVAEIDPAVTRLARDEMWLTFAAPLRILHQDGRAALQAEPRRPAFDVIFGDAFHDISVPPHLVSAEFHREIAARLTGDGFYVVNVVDSGPDPRFLFSLARTLEADFPVVEAWVERDQIGSPGRVTFVLVASRQGTAAPIVTASRGVERQWLRWPAEDLHERIAEAQVPLLTDDLAPVDRLMAGSLLAGVD